MAAYTLIKPLNTKSQVKQSLVVLDIYSRCASHLLQVMSDGAEISTLDQSDGAVKLIRGGALGESIIWICAEGLSADGLSDLEKSYLKFTDNALILVGSNDVSLVTRTLQCLIRSRRDNPMFRALVTTTDKQSTTQTTCRMMASQSGGWLNFEHKDPAQPDRIFSFIERHLSIARKSSSEIIEPATRSHLSLIEDPPSERAESSTESELSLLPVNETGNLTLSNPPHQGEHPMATLNDSMNACMQIDGAMAAALVDFGSGMALAKIGGGVNLDVAAAGNTEVLKAKMKTMASLGIKDTIEDLLITLGTQYHLIRPVPHKQGLFLYLVLDKTKGNLAMARFKLMEIEKSITV